MSVKSAERVYIEGIIKSNTDNMLERIVELEATIEHLQSEITDLNDVVDELTGD